MPFCINVVNVNEALDVGLRWLYGHNGQSEESRNGPVRVSPEPVITTYYKPQQRVLFSPMRDANPFFHLFESLWMLAGRNDLAYPKTFNSRFGEYSDDGLTVHGAYGHRWRNWFGYDQLTEIIEELRANPQSRRCVLSMWDAEMGFVSDFEQGKFSSTTPSDLFTATHGGKDVPCNTHIYFRVRDGKLDMTILCRSNDILWGAYGANAVHFSVLMEYIAFHVGVPMGRMIQFSNNYHAYTDVVGGVDRARALAEDSAKHDLYRLKHLGTQPLITSNSFTNEVAEFVETGVENDHNDYTEPFLQYTALPMLNAWRSWKEKDFIRAEADARNIRADDWREASVAWIARRHLAHRQKEQANG